jgi:hypothetical protein
MVLSLKAWESRSSPGLPRTVGCLLTHAPLWQARPRELYRDILLFHDRWRCSFRTPFKQDRRLGVPAAVFCCGFSIYWHPLWFRTMSDTDFPCVGHCRCGALRIEIAAPPVLTAACHCRGCQRMSASAFSLTAMVPAEAFKVLEGELVKGGIHGPNLDHYCCANCKSWVFTRIVGFDAFVNVRPTISTTSGGRGLSSIR